MGCIPSSGMMEVAGSSPADIEASGNPPYDQLHKRVTYTIKNKIKQKWMSVSSETKCEVDDDGLLVEILQQAQQNRLLVSSMPKLEMPKMDMGTAMKAMTGGTVEMAQTMDLFFSPPQPRPVDTVAVLVPVEMKTKVKSGLFSAKIDVKDQNGGFAAMNQTIANYYSSGWRLSLMSMTGSEGGAEAGLMKQKATSSIVMKLIFQKVQDDTSASAPPPAYKQWASFMFKTTIKTGMRGTVQEPFDLLKVLNEYGSQGWEMVSLMPVPNMPTEQQVNPMGMEIDMLYQVVMQQSSETPVKYIKQEERLKLGGIATGSPKIEGDLVPTINQAAQAGWRYFAAIPLAQEQNGFSMAMPYRMYFASR